MENSAKYQELLKMPWFNIFWIGRVVSGLGDILFNMATMWYVLTLTKSALITAIVTMIPHVTFILLGVPLATIVDRLPKKSVLILTDLLRGLIVLFVFWEMYNQRLGVFDIYITNFFIAVLGYMFGPAQMAVIPQMLSDTKRQLPLVNGLLTATSQVIRFTGYGAGGVLIAWLGTDKAILLDAISFVISALGFVLLPIPLMDAQGKSGVRGFLRDSSEGIRFVLGKKLFRICLLLAAFVNLAGAPIMIFSAIFAQEVLHAGVKEFGYLEGTFALGGILGAMIAGKWAWNLRLWQWFAISFLIEGIAMLMMPLIPRIGLAIVLFMFVSLAMTMMNVPYSSVIQLLAPPEMRGRVMNSFGLFVSWTTPVGLYASGWIIELIGAKLVFGFVGISLISAGIISLFIRSLRDESELSADAKVS